MAKLKILFYVKAQHMIMEQRSLIKERLKDYNVVVTTDKEEAKKEIVDTDIFCCFDSLASTEIIKAAKKLKWIHILSAGVNRIMPFVKDKPFLISNSRGVHAIPIAEHILAMMLMFERQINVAFRNQIKRVWERNNLKVSELYRKTAAVIGLGEIGLRVAGLCKALGTRVVAVKRTIADKPECVDELYLTEEMDKAIKQADYVVICLPLTKETRHVFGEKELKQMKKSAYIINIGRGEIIDEKALIKALKNKQIRGAGLDVFEQEPLPKSSPLWEMENVIATPHYAGLTDKYVERALDIFLKNLEAFKKKEKMPTEVDKELGY